MSNSVMTKEQLHSKEYVKAGAGAGKTYRITKKLGKLFGLLLFEFCLLSCRILI